MTFVLQTILAEACQDLGDLVSYRTDYSGRGMYGRSCVGIAGQGSDLREVIAYSIKQMTATIAATAKSGDDDALADVENDFDNCLDTLLDYCSDDLGQGKIFYWPELAALPD